MRWQLDSRNERRPVCKSLIFARSRHMNSGERVYEIYRHLGRLAARQKRVRHRDRYLEIGARRAHQQVPLSQLVWVIVLTKENLWEYLKREARDGTCRRSLGELEMLQLLEQFFDRAIYYAADRYDEEVAVLSPEADVEGS